MSCTACAQMQQPAAAQINRAAGSLQRKCAGCGQHTGGGACKTCQSNNNRGVGKAQGKAKVLQRKIAVNTPKQLSERSELPQSISDTLREQGQPLQSGLRADMEGSLGHNFSQVRIHTGSKAAESAAAVNARAFTYGNDIVFGAGQFSGESRAGRHLIAHELTHVAQQQSRLLDSAGGVRADARFEREADNVATLVSRGEKANINQFSSKRLFARQLHHSHTIKEQDGSEIVVERIITPGNCRLRPETRSSTTGDITRSNAFVEVTACRGNVSGGGRAELNYDQALNSASQALGNLLTGISRGQQPTTAFNTFQQDLRNISPEAKLSFNLNAGQFRILLEGTGRGNLAGNLSGTARSRVEFDVGPITIGVEPSVSGGTNQQTDGRIMVTVGNRRSQSDPNCFVCACSEPQVNHRCSRRPPPSTPGPNRDPVTLPLFFEYNDTTPRPGWEQQYDAMLLEAATRISDGYRITRIIGNASPEGSERPSSPTEPFRGNIELAQRRAIEARDDLNRVLRAQLSGLRMRGLDHIQSALDRSYPVEGRGELFGRSGNQEVSRAGLPAHLRDTLRLPANATDEVDPLVQQDVIGSRLPSQVNTEIRGAAQEFRAGRTSASTLYPYFRRALIYLDPPPISLDDLRLNRESAERIIGTPITCTNAHTQALASQHPMPTQGLFQGSECNRAGQRP